MVSLPCLAVGLLMNLVAALFVLTCIVLILIILIQKGRGGGLSSAFGGGGSGGVLGTKTGDFLTWVTISLVGVFLVLAVVMAKYYRPPDNRDQPTAQVLPGDTNSLDTGAAIPAAPALPETNGGQTDANE